jgi:hypothetical protein
MRNPPLSKRKTLCPRNLNAQTFAVVALMAAPSVLSGMPCERPSVARQLKSSCHRSQADRKVLGRMGRRIR